jgi:hypothetical protein
LPASRQGKKLPAIEVSSFAGAMQLKNYSVTASRSVFFLFRSGDSLEWDQSTLNRHDHRGHPIADAEFPEDIGQMEFDGLFRDQHDLPNFPIGLAFPAPPQARQLLRRELSRQRL